MEDRDIIETIARGMIERFGAEALHVAREEAKNAASMSDAETWGGVVEAIQQLTSKP
jgi:hypothetical protein